jgi:hypothetical protein
LVSAAFVEGIFAAVIAAFGGASLDAVARDAEDALQAKATHIQLQGPEQLLRAVPKWFPRPNLPRYRARRWVSLPWLARPTAERR